MLEALNTDIFDYERLKPEEMQRRGILGRLVGIMADTVNPTRNGRSYSSKLWENVFNNPIMKERIENNCCFGELGHPVDREETDMSKIAICMDGLPKKDKDGKLQAVFNILDTPNGRILKTLCDYGCNIGISSRGSGDLVTDFDGNESVDPDTYNCEGWDAVIIPAVKEARLKYVTESLDKKRYNKSLRSKLQETIDKETEDNKKVMTESLYSLGIRLNEDSNEDISVEDDMEIPEEETKDENDFFYKGIEILKDPNSGKFVCELDGDSYSFNSEKNAKMWIDINVKESINKDTLIKDLAYNTQRDIENNLSKVLSSDNEVQKVMRGKLSDLDNLIDVNKYLTEEQVGRDEVKDDKNVDDVLEPEVKDGSKEDTSEEDKEEDKNKVTVTITESIDWTELNSTEQFAAESAISYIEENPHIANDLDEIELAVHDAVSMYNEANAFDEYSDEDFYEEEADSRKVFKYVIQRLGLDEESNLTEDIDGINSARIKLVAKPFNYTMYYNGKQIDINSAVVVIPNAIKYGDGTVTDGSIICEDPRTGKSIDFKTVEEAQDWINRYGDDCLYRLEGNTLIATPKQLYDINNSVPFVVDNIESLTEDIDDINIARMQLCQVLDDWYRDNIANERAEDVKLSGWDSDLQSKYLDFRNYLAPDLIQDKEDYDLDVDNIESEIDSLQEMLNYNKTLEKQIIELNEKLSVSHAMEKSLKAELRESKEKISTLSKTSKENKILTEQLTAAKDSAAKLNESKKENVSKIKSLKEKLNVITQERDAQNTELSTLREDYDILTRDLNQTKEQFSKKFEKQNQLLEKYQKITKTAVDRYINMQATNLGVKPIEIKNRLSESFTFNDIDSVCEDLRDYKLNVSKLPFRTNSQLTEGIEVKANNVNRNSLLPRNEIDELNDYDLKLMEAYL